MPTKPASADLEAPPERVLCEAKGMPCILNCVCAPFVLCFQALKIYCCVCCLTYIARSFTGVCCCLCRAVCKSCYRFTDKKFPANSKSIGAWKGKEAGEVSKEVVWQRAEDYFHDKLTAGQKQDGVRLKLFEGGVEPKPCRTRSRTDGTGATTSWLPPSSLCRQRLTSPARP